MTCLEISLNPSPLAFARMPRAEAPGASLAAEVSADQDMGGRMACPGAGVKGNKKAIVLRLFFSSHIAAFYGMKIFHSRGSSGSIRGTLPGSDVL